MFAIYRFADKFDFWQVGTQNWFFDMVCPLSRTILYLKFEAFIWLFILSLADSVVELLNLERKLVIKSNPNVIWFIDLDFPFVGQIDSI